MQFLPVPLDASLGDLAGTHVAVSGVGLTGGLTLSLMTVAKPKGNRVRVTCMDVGIRNDPPPQVQSAMVPVDATLSATVTGFGQIRPISAGQVPKIVWRNRPSFFNSPKAIALIVAATITLCGIGVFTAQPAFISLGLALFFSVPLALVLERRITPMPAYVKEDGNELLPSKVRSRLGRPLPSGPSPEQRVAQVKAAYGELLADVIYRIENSALFDPAVAETERFQLALLAWDPHSPAAEDLATELETSFEAARAQAERLGLQHLPESARDTARRAAKAAGVALGKAAEAERLAAKQQVADLLGSLALYWLPTIDPDAPTLIGQRKMIEPA